MAKNDVSKGAAGDVLEDVKTSPYKFSKGYVYSLYLPAELCLLMRFAFMIH